MTTWHIIGLAGGCMLFSFALALLVGRAIAAADRLEGTADEHSQWLGADAGGSFTHNGSVSTDV